jgi:hypothetical protein
MARWVAREKDFQRGADRGCCFGAEAPFCTGSTGFRGVYCKRPNLPQLKVRRRTETDDQEVLALAWQAANDKARELGWIV